MKRTTYTVLPFEQLLVVAALCGGSESVRYGRLKPETQFVAELQLRHGEQIWLFVHPPGGRLAARVSWRDDLWTILSSHGIQTADCPTEIWAGSARFFRTENIPEQLLSFEVALTHDIAANPNTHRKVEFDS